MSLVERFNGCISNWNRKLLSMDDAVPGNVASSFRMNPDVNDINYYANNLSIIGEDYVKELIKYGDDVIEKVSTFKGTLSQSPSREEQDKIMSDIRNEVGKISFPRHPDKRFRGIGGNIVFLSFPLKTNTPQLQGWKPPYSNWRQDIPELIIERINCYLNALKVLVGDTTIENLKTDASNLAELEERMQKQTFMEAMAHYGGNTSKRRKRKIARRKRKTARRNKSKNIKKYYK